MTALVSQGLAGVLDTLADVIEGGNTWRGSGTVFKGIPGQYSFDPRLRDGSDATITVDEAVSTTQFRVYDKWASNRWTSNNGPRYWVVDSSGEHRKITDATFSEDSGAGVVSSVRVTPNVLEAGTYRLTIGTATVAPEYGSAPSEETLLSDLQSIMEVDEDLTVVVSDHYITVTIAGGSAIVTASANLTLEKTYSTQPQDSTLFTVAPALTTAPAAEDTLTVLQGFKRVPNHVDIEEETGAADGFDRYFHLSADAGKRTDWSGSGTWTFETDLHLRVRFLKNARLHDWTVTALTNMAILRAGIARTIHYDSTYMRALIPNGSIRTVRDDTTKLVVEDTFKLFYRLNTSFL